MLRATADAVQAGITAGKTADQLKTEKVLEPWADWGKGFIKSDRFIDLLYRDLSRK